MSKKLISIIVSCALVLSLALVGVIGVSAAIDTDGRYVPSEGVETHIAEPYQDVTVSVNGPAVVLVVID